MSTYKFLGYGYGNGASDKVLNFIDNHDNQVSDKIIMLTRVKSLIGLIFKQNC